MEMLNGVCFPCKGGLFWYLNILNKLSHINNNKKDFKDDLKSGGGQISNNLGITCNIDLIGSATVQTWSHVKSIQMFDKYPQSRLC